MMSTATTPTHAELVRHAERWAWQDWDALIVLPEYQLPAWLRENKQQDRGGRKQRESPDVFAVLRNGNTLVIECKVDEGDAAQDHRKDHRAYGMGDIRVMLSLPYIVEDHQVNVASGWNSYWYDPATGQITPRVQLEEPVRRSEVNILRERLFLAQAMRGLEKESGKRAQEARPSQQGRIPKAWHEVIRNALAENGPMRAIAIVKGPMAHYRERETRRSKFADWLARDARAGLIEGVTAEGYPAVLRLKEGEG